MSDSNSKSAPSRRWLTWQAGERKIEDSAETEPTKPSEPGFDGFDGSSSAQSADIEAPPREPETHRAPVDSSTLTERVMSWAEWKAGALNQLFLELGSTGRPGRITPDTIRHSEQAWMTNLKNRDVVSQKSPRSE
jgi:hypothetical protein